MSEFNRLVQRLADELVDGESIQVDEACYLGVKEKLRRFSDAGLEVDYGYELDRPFILHDCDDPSRESLVEGLFDEIWAMADPDPVFDRLRELNRRLGIVNGQITKLGKTGAADE